jgi:hypothetical protein
MKSHARMPRAVSRSLQGVRGEPQIGEGPVEVGVQVVGAIGPHRRMAIE